MAAGPQVEVVDGRIMFSQGSLPVDPTARASTTDVNFGDSVVEDSSSATGEVGAPYSSYLTPRGRPRQWGVAETRAFYRALRQCGTDFNMMRAFLGERNRPQLLRKFKRECKMNPKLVDLALDPVARFKLGERRCRVPALVRATALRLRVSTRPSRSHSSQNPFFVRLLSFCVCPCLVTFT